MTLAIVNCYVGENSGFPSHRPPIIEVVTKLLEATIKELQKPTNFAWMLNQKIDKEVEEAQMKRETELANGNESYEGEKEHCIRERNIDRLHEKMNEAIDKRKHRLAYAVKTKDTSTQWGLIAAGVAEGVIECFEFEGKEATR